MRNISLYPLHFCFVTFLFKKKLKLPLNESIIAINTLFVARLHLRHFNVFFKYLFTYVITCVTKQQLALGWHLGYFISKTFWIRSLNLFFNLNTEIKLTCPCWSSSLLVSLTFSNETICFMSCSPVNGESGWTYNLREHTEPISIRCSDWLRP